MFIGLVSRRPRLACGAREPANEAAILDDLVVVVNVEWTVALQQPLFHVIRAKRIVRSRLLVPETAVLVVPRPEIAAL
jgi:hypothetical protein